MKLLPIYIYCCLLSSILVESSCHAQSKVTASQIDHDWDSVVVGTLMHTGDKPRDSVQMLIARELEILCTTEPTQRLERYVLSVADRPEVFIRISSRHTFYSNDTALFGNQPQAEPDIPGVGDVYWLIGESAAKTRLIRFRDNSKSEIVDTTLNCGLARIGNELETYDNYYSFDPESSSTDIVSVWSLGAKKHILVSRLWVLKDSPFHWVDSSVPIPKGMSALAHLLWDRRCE